MDAAADGGGIGGGNEEAMWLMQINQNQRMVSKVGLQWSSIGPSFFFHRFLRTEGIYNAIVIIRTCST